MSTTTESTLKFKVSEALSKDIGRCLARLDPEDMAKLGVEIGDVIEISGKARPWARS